MYPLFLFQYGLFTKILPNLFKIVFFQKWNWNFVVLNSVILTYFWFDSFSSPETHLAPAPPGTVVAFLCSFLFILLCLHLKSWSAVVWITHFFSFSLAHSLIHSVGSPRAWRGCPHSARWGPYSLTIFITAECAASYMFLYGTDHHGLSFKKESRGGYIGGLFFLSGCTWCLMGPRCLVCWCGHLVTLTSSLSVGLSRMICPPLLPLSIPGPHLSWHHQGKTSTSDPEGIKEGYLMAEVWLRNAVSVREGACGRQRACGLREGRTFLRGLRLVATQRNGPTDLFCLPHVVFFFFF